MISYFIARFTNEELNWKFGIGAQHVAGGRRGVWCVAFALAWISRHSSERKWTTTQKTYSAICRRRQAAFHGFAAVILALVDRAAVALPTLNAEPWFRYPLSGCGAFVRAQRRRRSGVRRS